MIYCTIRHNDGHDGIDSEGASNIQEINAVEVRELYREAFKEIDWQLMSDERVFLFGIRK